MKDTVLALLLLYSPVPLPIVVPEQAFRDVCVAAEILGKDECFYDDEGVRRDVGLLDLVRLCRERLRTTSSFPRYSDNRWLPPYAVCRSCYDEARWFQESIEARMVVEQHNRSQLEPLLDNIRWRVLVWGMASDARLNEEYGPVIGREYLEQLRIAMGPMWWRQQMPGTVPLAMLPGER